MFNIILTALLGLMPLQEAPPEPVTCTAVEWVSLIEAVPSDEWCELPESASWTLEDTSYWSRWAWRTDDLQYAFDLCVDAGGTVMSSQRWRRASCFGTPYGLMGPCRRPSVIVVLEGDHYWPMVPDRRCNDTVIELLPGAECALVADCERLRFFDGWLHFTIRLYR